jgi:hypothetical protein
VRWWSKSFEKVEVFQLFGPLNAAMDHGSFGSCSIPMRLPRWTALAFAIMYCGVESRSRQLPPLSTRLQAQLSVVYTFRQTDTLGSSFQAFTNFFVHDDEPALVYE